MNPDTCLDEFKKTMPMVYQVLRGTLLYYLEVGVYKGQSACLVMDRYLEMGGHATLIDPRDYSIPEENLKNHTGSFTYIQDHSYNILPRLHPDGQYQLVYIDGDHRADAVYRDLEDSWRLVTKGGIVICDDYERDLYEVKSGVDAFLQETPEWEYSILSKGYQLVLRKEV